MALIDDKRAIFGQIAALRTLNEGFPKISLANSFPSVNNQKNSLSFLLDLLKALVGYEELRTTIIDILTYDMDNIENNIKLVLKKELKKLVNCGVDPSIPDFLKHQSIIPSSIGVDLDLKKIDFTGLMYINPTSAYGGLFYNDITNGINSTDFNTFLFNAVQNDGIQENWGASVTGNNILSLKFTSTGPPNNILNIKASAYYSNPINGKTLTDLNNDYIDSVKLFTSDKIITNIIDTLFGSVSVNLNKSRKQLEQEAAIDNIVESILSTDESDVIDDSYFSFSNDEIRFQQEIADSRKRGLIKIKTSEELEVSIPSDSLNTLYVSITGSTNKIEEKAAISTAINEMGDQVSSTAKNGDKYNIKLSFIDGLIRKLMSAIINILLSPKVISIIALNHKIIHGPSAIFDGPIDFMKKNKTLIKGIINGVRETITQVLLKKALIAVRNLISENATATMTERTKLNQAQILSLVGVPQDVLRTINNLG